MNDQDRARAAFESGDVATAHRLLEGRMGQVRYDPETYRLFGEVLERLGRNAEAGKYLFLGGEPTQREAVRAFLDREGSENWRRLWSSFPNHAKHVALDQLPQNVRQKLIELGAPTTYPHKDRVDELAEEAMRTRDVIAGAMLLGVLGFLLWLLGSFVAPP